jgi:hypothetical protein
VNLSFDLRALQKTGEKLQAELAARSEAALASPSPDFAGYSRKVGEYYGIKRAMEILKEVEKEMGL